MADLYSTFWENRWDLIASDPEDEELREDLARCTGPGKCHGCLKWCTFCGDVSDMCDVTEWPHRCDQHERYPQRPLPDPRQLVLFAE